MSLRVFWSEDALADVQSVFAFIAQENVQNAHLVADRIEHSVDLLSDTPFGRPGRVKGTYEIVVPKTPFIIAYQLVEGKCINILHVIHGARDWKEGEWPK